MDSSYIDPEVHDSRIPRSISSSKDNFTQSSLHSFNINKTSSTDTIHPPPDTYIPPPPPLDLVDQHLEHPSSTTSLSKQNTHTLPSDTFNKDWTLQKSPHFQQAEVPFLQFLPPQPESESQERLNEINQNIPLSSDDMSALGIQSYDARLGVGIRPTYTWPSFDMNQQYTNQPMANLTPYTDVNNVPTYARSLSYSPPRSVFTPEQRELKRQQDLARRSSKSRVRRERSTSGSVNTSQSTTPDLLPRTMPAYTQTMVSRPLTAEDTTSLSTPNYIAPFHAQLSGNPSPELFGAPFMPQNDFSTLNDYHVSYPAPGSDPSMPMYSPRQLPIPSSGEQQAYPGAPGSSPASQDGVRVVGARPKPQCWEHGCNGRQFSTFSNLLRHQREKSGVAAKAVCPKCGAEFTRTTARNGHMAHEKCKTRRNS